MKRKEPWYGDEEEPDAADEEEVSSNDFYGEQEDDDRESNIDVNNSDNTSEARALSNVRYSFDCSRERTHWKQNRPSLPGRSSTDPMARPIRTKPVAPPSGLVHQHSTPETRNPPSEAEWRNSEVNGTMPKKRKYDQESSAAPSTIAPPPTSAGFQDLLGITFDERRLREIIHEGRLRAREAALTAESERTSLRTTFDASVSRANRRAHEADEKLRWTLHQHGEAMKLKDKEHEEKLQQLRTRLVDAATKRGDAHTEEIHALKRTIDRQMEEREDLEGDNAILRKELKLAKNVIARHVEDNAASTKDSEDLEILRSFVNVKNNEGKSLEQMRRTLQEAQDKIHSLETELAHRPTLSEVDRKPPNSYPAFHERPMTLPAPQTINTDHILAAVDSATTSFNDMASFVSKLHRNLDDMTMKGIVNEVGQLLWKVDTTNSLLHQLRATALPPPELSRSHQPSPPSRSSFHDHVPVARTDDFSDARPNTASTPARLPLDTPPADFAAADPRAPEQPRAVEIRSAEFRPVDARPIEMRAPLVNGTGERSPDKMLVDERDGPANGHV